MKSRFLALNLLLTACAVLNTQAAPPAKLELQKGDHIAILGNTLADRQQHFGWLEALIHRQWPQHNLLLRNLAVAADEVDVRPRSDDVPKQDEWLTQMKADVILAYFGFNESFQGEAGLQKFKESLDKFIKETIGKQYNGKGAPRLVIVSPIAQEDLKSPDYPDGSANNPNIALYAKAMAEVAAANNVQFADLLKASQEAYAAEKQPLTHNGIHMTNEGDQAFAPYQFKALFGAEAPKTSDPLVLKIRDAVLDRNKQWHHRYRSVDQYNIYGGRSRIVYAGVTNNTTVMQEMAQRDVLTANRDRHIWEVANGRESMIDDNNLPPVDAVPTNKPDTAPYLSGEEAIKHMKVPDGCKIELVASEETFPELVKPVQMAFDTKGRLFVAAWPNYPGNTPTTKDFDKLLAFDLDPKTGKATKVTRYLDGLNCPTGFQFYKDGVLIMQSPDLWFVRDTDGDGKADWKERVLNGLDAADSHHETNSICLEPGGAVYLSDGVFHRTSVETLTGPVRNTDGCIYRFEPRTNKFERYAAYGFANPHGRVFDYWGNDIITDATGNANYFAPAFSGFLSSGKHASMKQFWERPSRPCPGTNYLTSRHFPDDWQGNFLNANVISFQGIYRVKVSEEGSGLRGDDLEPLIFTDIAKDPNFRPSAVTVAPDGSIYFCDWSNALIGHLQHHLRDPKRDHEHGRIYRITFPSRPLLEPKKIAGEPVEKLLELLKEPENDVRMRAKIELGARDSKLVLAQTKLWVSHLDKADAKFEHNRLEGLWVHQWHNVVDTELLNAVLKASDPRARAQAVRVLSYWRDRVPNALDLLKIAANDEAPRVRLEAVRALSFFSGDQGLKAIEVAFDILKKDMDYYLDYTFKETLKQLQAVTNQKVLPADASLLATYMGKLTDDELAGLPDKEPVLLAKLERKGYDVMRRDNMLKALAKAQNKDRASTILALLDTLDQKGNDGAAQEAVKLMVTTPPADLAKARASLVELAGKAKRGPARKAAWAGLVIADGNADAVWADAKAGPDKVALLQAIALVPDPTLRAKFQGKLTEQAGAANDPATLKALLTALPLMGAPNAVTNFAVLAKNLIAGQERLAAANAIMQLPRDSWNKEQAGPIAKSILEYAKTVDQKKRSDQDFVELNQVAMEMASLAGDVALRKELRGLGVAVFVVKTVREQMRYDTARIVVEQGKPFEILFENNDVMPHNLVVVDPDKHMEIGMAAMTMPPSKKDKQGRQYLPEGQKFIAATKLIEAEEKEKLQLTAPKKEGEYEFVCTFPGHAILMWGKLVVTKDVDAYLAAHPTYTLPGIGAVPTPSVEVKK